MNLIKDDTRLAPNEYHESFDVRNRFDILDPVLDSVIQDDAPAGVKQGIYTFGDYILLFCAGSAYYKRRDIRGWTKIDGFLMSNTAPRYWVESVPVNTTNYGRIAVQVDSKTTANGPVSQIPTANIGGDRPGVLVQDNINQPWFMFVNADTVVARQTQKYSDWKYDSTGVNDKREYVPIGNAMAWANGILFIVAPDTNTIYRSVSGRPLDFVVNVDVNGNPGGDATTTAYSVGIGGITCIRPLATGGVFVSASNIACFAVTLNQTPNAPTIFGEYTFNRQFLFTAGCVTDRAFVDILGDTAFIDVEGLRSFNAILQSQNEGRNSIFSLKVSPLFKGIIQTPIPTAAIVYDNYALFAVNTIYGYLIVVYDTLNQCYVCMDTQSNGQSIKQFAKVETTTTRLYAITGDDKVIQLYVGPGFRKSTVRLQSICASVLYANENISLQNPKSEIQMSNFRCVLGRFRADSTVTILPIVNNHTTRISPVTKMVKYISPTYPFPFAHRFDDLDTGIANLFFNLANCEQGWKVYILLSWTGGGSITNWSAILKDLTPKTPLKTQSNELST